MKELKLFSTRIKKDLNDRVKVFCKEKKVTVQKFTEYAFEKTLRENENIKSEATLFMERKLFETTDDKNIKAHELLSEILFNFDKKKFTDLQLQMIEEYENLIKQEEIAFDFYHDTLYK